MISLKSLFVIVGCWIALAVTFLLMALVYIPTWNWDINSISKFTSEDNTTEEVSTDLQGLSYNPFPDPILLSSYLNITTDKAADASETNNQDSDPTSAQLFPDLKEDSQASNEDDAPQKSKLDKWDKYWNRNSSSSLMQDNNFTVVKIPIIKQKHNKKKAHAGSSYSPDEVESVLEKIFANDILKTYDELTSEEHESNENSIESSDDSIFSMLKSHDVFPLKSANFDNETWENEIDSDENVSNEIDPSVSSGQEKESTLENLYDYTPDEHVDITKAIYPLDNLENESKEEADRINRYNEQKSLMLGALFSALQQADTKEATALPCSNAKKTSMNTLPKIELEIRISQVDFINDADDNSEEQDNADNDEDDDDEDYDTNSAKLLISKVQTLETLAELYSLLVYLFICACSLLVILICIIIFANIALKHFETDLLEFMDKGTNRSKEMTNASRKPMIETV